jgi:hypothetical protein
MTFLTLCSASLSLQAPMGKACAASPTGVPASAARTLAVLDPVDLTTRRPDSARGEFLRRSFALRPGWKVIDPDSMRAREKEFGFSAYRGCHEFQCAFDAGNIFASEFVLFSSLTRLGGVYAYTLNLVHVPSSRILWSKVGQAGPGAIGDPRIQLEAAWTRLVGRLPPDKAPAAALGKPGQITVLDLSPARWAPAQAIAERLATHLYDARGFDIMGSREQDELIGALGIDKAAFIPTDSAVFGLGRRMGVSHLVSSRLIEDRRHALRLELGYYDIAGQRKVKVERSGYAHDPVDILRFETRFFASLFPIEKDGEDGLEGKGRSWPAWAAGAAGAAGIAAGIAGGFLAYRFDQASRRKYGQIEASRSRESALELRGEAAGLERRSRAWGAVGIAGALAGGAMIIISF